MQGTGRKRGKGVLTMYLTFQGEFPGSQFLELSRSGSFDCVAVAVRQQLRSG